MISKTHVEMGQKWLELDAINKEAQRPDLPLERKQFEKSIWSRFDPRLAGKILADERGSYFGHKEAVLAGLTAWLLAPTDDQLRQDAIALAAQEAMAGAERDHLKALKGAKSAVDFGVRHGAIGPYFLEEIYFPIGGTDRLLKAPASEVLRDRYAAQEPAVRGVCEVIRIYHYHLVHGGGPRRRRPPGLEGAVTIIDDQELKYQPTGEKLRRRKIPPEGLSFLKKDALRKKWRARHPTLALIYAASAISVGHISLLDLVISGRANVKDHGGLMPRWLAYARYAAKDILGRSHKSDVKNASLNSIPTVPSEMFSAPNLPPNYAEEIDEKWRYGKK